tara:strand:+ start:1509 stop:1673 length:165 start_codon:yes stop_codon:yes gene_type:complete
MNLDNLMRSKYTSLACALLNAYFAVNSAVAGKWVWFAICGVFGAYCFKNFLVKK